MEQWRVKGGEWREKMMLMLRGEETLSKLRHFLPRVNTLSVHTYYPILSRHFKFTLNDSSIKVVAGTLMHEVIWWFFKPHLKLVLGMLIEY